MGTDPGTPGGDTSAQLTGIDSEPGEMVFDVLGLDSNGNTYTMAAGSGQTVLWTQTSSTLYSGGCSLKAGAASVATSWTWSPADARQYALGAVSIKPSTHADVATTVSGPDSVFATTNFTYTISVTNLGSSTASNILVSDTLPGGLNVVGVSGDGIVIGGGPGQVLFDSGSSNSVSGVTNWTHVTTSATNRLLLVGISSGTGVTVSNITYGGLNLSRVQTVPGATASSEIWQLVNPPSGANPITIIRSGTGGLVAGAATFSGVDQTTPLGAVSSLAGQSSSPTNTISSATNEIVFDNLAYDKTGNPTSGSGQTQLWGILGAESGCASIRPGRNSATMSWAIPTANWSDIAVSIRSVPQIDVVNWTIPTLACGATTNFTITVTAPLSGTLTNTVASTTTTPDSNPENNDGRAATAQVLTTVLPLADVVTTQSGPTTVAPLTNYTCMVTVSNQGPSTASSVVVADTLSPTLTYVSSSDGGSYLAGVVTWPALASLPRGATASFTVTVRSPISGNLTNTAASTSTATDPNAGNNNGSGPAAKAITAVSPLQVANTSKGAAVQTLNWSHTVDPGSSRILIVGVSIDSTNATVNAATFNNFLPLTLIGQTNGAQTRVLLYQLVNPPVGKYAVSINLNTAAGIVGGAASFNGVNQANPITAFSGNSGTSTNATLTVASTLGGVVIDTVAPKSPQYATNPGPAQTIEWNLSGANFSGAGGSSYGAASVSPSWALDSPTNWAMGAVALNPATILSDIALGATGPASVPATSNLTYFITVTNLGSATASNVVVSHVLPAGAIFVSASSGGTANAGVVSWPALANFAIGGTTNYSITLQAPASGTLTNIAYCTSTTADPDPSNNNGTWTNNQILTTVTPLADVATTVTGPADAFVTADFSYTVTVNNTGPSPASDLVVSDTLPAGAAFVGASDGGTHDAGVVTWSLASLDSGAATNFTITVTAPAGGILTNTVASTSDTSDLVPSNNDGSAPTAQVLTTVTPVADIATTVTGPESVSAATDFSYTLTVTNQGPSPAGNVMVSNTLDASVVLVSTSGSGSNYAGVVVWSIPRLATGEATNFTVTVTAPADGSLLNTVASASATTDLVPSNNDGSATDAQVLTTVTPVGDVATTVTGPFVAITNTPFNYTVTVTNLGPSGATGISVNDLLPTGVVFVSATAGGTPNAGIVAWSLDGLASGAATNLIVTVVAPGAGPVTNMVSSSAMTADPNASNNNGLASTASVVTGVYPFLLLNGQWRPSEGFQVEFYTYPGSIYSLQTGTNLVDWITLITTNSGDGHVIYLDADFASDIRRFYRVRQGP